MTDRTPTLPQAAFAAALTLGASIVATAWITFNSRRFVQISGMHGRILDSRTGCVWRMTISPPLKSCPGDSAQETEHSSPTPQAIIVPPENLTPDSFMATHPSFVPDAPASVDSFMAVQASHGTANLSDIVDIAAPAVSPGVSFETSYRAYMVVLPNLPPAPKPTGLMTSKEQRAAIRAKTGRK
jgi:hypothetical protein